MKNEKKEQNFLVDPRQYRKTIRLTFQYEMRISA